MFGTFTAYVASLFVQKEDTKTEKSMASELAAIRERLERLEMRTLGSES